MATLSLLLVIMWRTHSAVAGFSTPDVWHWKDIMPSPELRLASVMDVNGRPADETRPYYEGGVCANDSKTPAFLYLVTGTGCPEAKWEAIALRSDAAIFYVGWETTCDTPTDTMYFFNSKGTWTANRNFLGLLAREYEQKLGCFILYHVYADADILLVLTSAGEEYRTTRWLAGPVDVMHHAVLELRPLIVMPRYGQRNHTGSRAAPSPMAVPYPDPCINIFSPRARQAYLPYDEKFDAHSFWASQTIIHAMTEAIFHRNFAELQEIRVDNPEHHKYPRQKNMHDYALRGVADIEHKFGVVCNLTADFPVFARGAWNRRLRDSLFMPYRKLSAMLADNLTRPFFAAREHGAVRCIQK